MKKKHLKALFVVGYIASGKSTYVDKIKKDDDLVIELGDIVREVTHKEERVFSNDLDNDIYDRCRDLIGEYYDQISRVVFVAPRSPKLMQSLIELMGRKYSKIVFLSVPQSIREIRYNSAKRLKDSNIDFHDATEKDNSIGMQDLALNLLDGSYGKFEVVYNN